MPTLIDQFGSFVQQSVIILRNASGPDAERVRKKVTQFFFQHHQLKVTVDTNLIQTDFLDVTLNLCTGRYWPYRKPNDQPLYINVQSNHPPWITKKLPYMIVKRISDISCDVDAFSSSLPAYEEALKQSGHKIQPLPFERAIGRNKRRQRRRKVIWFNPPTITGFPPTLGSLLPPPAETLPSIKQAAQNLQQECG